MEKSKRWIIFYLLTIICVLSLADRGSRAVTVIAENAPIKGRTCIVLDPGHGGEDGGATSCTGVLESTYNLSISTRLNEIGRAHV